MFHYGSGKTNPMNNVKLHRNIKEVPEKEKEVNICFNNTDKEQQQNIFFKLIP